MPKRRHSDVEEGFNDRAVKRRYRTDKLDQLSNLSDELLLRIFSNLPLSTLTRCERLNRRLSLVARDSQIWKTVYYNRWVKPRATQIPGRRFYRSELFSSQPLRWLDHDALLKRGGDIDWKRQYKIRHNWTKGVCDISEIHLADRSVVNVAPCVCLHNSIAFAADAAGLRAWDLQVRQRLIAHASMEADEDDDRVPRALSVDTTSDDEAIRVAVGFQNGSLEVYELRTGERSFHKLYSRSSTTLSALQAIAFSSPVIATLSDTQNLAIYQFEQDETRKVLFDETTSPRCLGEFKSQNAWPPQSLAIRTSTQHILVSVAYALPTYLSGWSLGLQELWLDRDGNILNSRLASAVSSAFRPLKARASQQPAEEASYTAARMSRPTSISYTHPYLLSSHADNTLTLHLVTSTAQALSIGPGSSLFGHTSSVACAHVGGRGKAVSVSRFGDELRLWELEGGLSAASTRRRIAAGDSSIQIRPGRRSDAVQDLALAGPASEASITASEASITALAHDVQPERLPPILPGLAPQQDTPQYSAGSWVDFDDEKVVVLRDQDHGSTALLVYDFA